MHNITVLAIDNSSIHTLRARSTTRVVSIDACLKCMHTTLLASIYIYIIIILYYDAPTYESV